MILERVTNSRSAADRIGSDVIPRQRILGARQRNVAAPRPVAAFDRPYDTCPIIAPVLLPAV